MKKIKNIIIFVVLATLAFGVLNLFKSRLSLLEIDYGIWILLWTSVFLNLGVIVYHYSIPAHPKFLILPQRKWTLRVHIWSGTLELLFGIGAVFLNSPKAALLQGLVALGGHVPTALLQTPIVFGSKAVMVPSYLLCIFIHAFCSYQLILDPNSHSWAICTFLIFNVYAWCRFYFYFFDRFHLFGDQKYSTSILFAGLTIIPTLFGPLSMLLLVFYIGVYFLLVRILFIRNQEQYVSFIHERARDSVLTSQFLQTQVHAKDVLALKNESERDKAEFVFNLLKGPSAYLREKDLSALLTEWGLSKKEVIKYFAYLGESEISFEIFLHKLSSVWRYIYFDVFRSLNSESSEMIGRSLESIRSQKDVQKLRSQIQVNLLEKVSFLSMADPFLIEDLASSLTLRKCKANEIIFKEGETGERFYLIHSGFVDIIKNNNVVARLNPGDYFGEIALIESSARNATVVSGIECEFYTLSKSSFDYVLSRHPEVKEQMIHLIGERR